MHWKISYNRRNIAGSVVWHLAMLKYSTRAAICRFDLFSFSYVGVSWIIKLF